MNIPRKTSNAVRILHRRYVGDDSQRKASLERERVNAEAARTIYELREQAGLSQKELAERIRTTQSVISRLEDADYDGHSLTMLNRIAKALNQEVQVVMRPKEQKQTSPSPQPSSFEETDKLLHKFEIDNFPAQYREYYGIKRNNLFASIQRFREQWEYYVRLDAIWMREFEDLKIVRDETRMFPLVLYLSAHAKIRVAIELALSGCMAEARSILRDAIEFLAHAHAMLHKPELQKVWLSKNHDNEDFKNAFGRNKKEGVFKGLDELYKKWGELSEMGSHATINAVVGRFQQIMSDDHIEHRLTYSGLEDNEMWAKELFSMLLTCFTMEQTFFNDYESRLKLDNELVRMRGEFERYKEG